jgi:hypothetical protein
MDKRMAWLILKVRVANDAMNLSSITSNGMIMTALHLERVRGRKKKGV